MPSQRDSEPHTPEKSIKRHEYDTVRKSRFFELFDSRRNADSLRQICKNPQINIPPSTGRRWLNERDHLGDKAFRRTRKLSKRLGRKYIVATETLDDLLRKDNPLNTKPYETIVKELQVGDNEYSATARQSHTVLGHKQNNTTDSRQEATSIDRTCI